jgi:hypothetical protein
MNGGPLGHDDQFDHQKFVAFLESKLTVMEEVIELARQGEQYIKQRAGQARDWSAMEAEAALNFTGSSQQHKDHTAKSGKWHDIERNLIESAKWFNKKTNDVSEIKAKIIDILMRAKALRGDSTVGTRQGNDQEDRKFEIGTLKEQLLDLREAWRKIASETGDTGATGRGVPPCEVAHSKATTGSDSGRGRGR